jgi:D-alanine-D-alanine ligase
MSRWRKEIAMMKIGITYDLRADYLAQGYGEEETAEFDRADTIDAIEQTLQELDFQTDRIGNVWNLTARLGAGERWDLVFNIAEGLKGFGREAQVPALLDAYSIPYTFSDPLVLALTLHKGMTKHVIRDLGVPTPDFAVVERDSDIGMINLPFPLFAKPVAEGTGKGINAASKICDRRGLVKVCRGLLARYNQPVLVETFLPGREFTVGIIGTGKDAVAVGVMEILLRSEAEREVYSYVNKEQCEELVTYRLAEDDLAKKAAEVALAAWRGLGCRDAGRLDLRVGADGVPHFLEVNPLAGLHPEHSDLPILSSLAGIGYRELIWMIMASALKRVADSQIRVPRCAVRLVKSRHLRTVGASTTSAQAS